MKRKILSLALLAGIASMSLAAQAANAPLILRSVDVTLPDDGDRDLPDGPGVAALRNNCVSCHSAGMILNQPALPKVAWEAEVAKMRNVYKAPIGDKDVPDIVGYLTAVKGPK
jgi:hypothetical protein